MIRYNYGDCIPISENAFLHLRKKGYPAFLVAGKVLPNDEERYEEYNPNSKNNWIDHTWVICKNHLIDLTKNQFNEYEGIREYKPLYYYVIKDNKVIIRKPLKKLEAGQIYL